MSGSTIVGLGIHIKVADFDKSRAFYEALGFRPVFAYGSEEFRQSLPSELPSAFEHYRGMSFAIGNSAELEIAEGHIAVADSDVFRQTITSPKVSAMVKVESLVPLLQGGVPSISYPVRRYYWNTVEAAFRDPDGFVLVFIAPFSDSELEAVKGLVPVETVEQPPRPTGRP
jgi:catechol 2,3-dioxygenase-like lactoylglutathione lyase family enzyme